MVSMLKREWIKRNYMGGNIINFVNHNLMLSMVFILVVVVYVSFELFNWLSKDKLENQVSPTKLTILFNHHNALLVDIRAENEYNLEHIIDSINIPSANVNNEHKIIKSNANRPIIIVDEHGGKYASVYCTNLRKLGIKEVSYLYGGLKAWRASNMPLVKSTDQIVHAIKPENIIIYTKEACPYCLSAKNLLRSKGYAYREIEIKGADAKEFIDMVNLSGGLKTIPQIFINNQHIGGFDSLKDLNDKGELDRMLKNI